ncbi:MAG TPA: P-loop NTPase [Myxococcota bacterium]|nr:P-loop NTPase [Myxococcota bacterium]
MKGETARFVAVVSGKGGVGKTHLVANLAIAAARLGARPLVVDGDLGLANVDVLLGLSPTRSVADALAGACPLADTIVDGPSGIRLLPAASARQDLASPDGVVLARFLAELRAAAEPHDLVLVDAGAGIGRVVTGLAAACGRALVVTTPEPTSVADAYAAIKVLRAASPSAGCELVVNDAADAEQARRTASRLELLARRFLGATLQSRGWLPSDPRLREATSLQRAVVEAFPSARWSRALVALAEGLLRDVRETRRPAPLRAAEPAGATP